MSAPNRPLRILSALALGVAALLPGAAQPPGAPVSTLGDVPAGIAAHIAASEYHVSHSALGLQAPNRAQGIRTFFHDGSVEVVPRLDNASWRFAWSTERWGRAGTMRRAVPVEPAFAGARAVYERPDLSEWYENRSDGVEQGFTVHARPAGSGELRVEGRIADGARALLNVDEGHIDFTAGDGTRILRYSKLVAWDASGRVLASRMELDGRRIALVVDDAGASYPVTIDPLLSPPSWSVVDAQASSDFGGSVSTAGDVNGDGYSDVIVGARQYDGGEAFEGRAYVFLGSPTGPSAVADWTVEADTAQAQFGWSVCTAGDVNGDGFADVIVGAPKAATFSGRAYVYHGSSSGPGTTPSWTAMGVGIGGASLGWSVGTAGDVNGDGYADVIVGAPTTNEGQSGEGAAYVYHGSASGLPHVPDWSFDSNDSSAWFGSSVSTAGDVNGDGFADVIVGSYAYTNGQTDEGVAFVFHGSASGLSPTPADTLEADQASADYGFAVSTAGDVNGDGYSDVIVGARNWDGGQSNEGKVFVYLGAPSGVVNTPFFTYENDQFDAKLGSSVGTAGDVNGDGLADIVFGAPRMDVLNPDDGIAYVFEGDVFGALTFTWSGFSNEPGSLFGGSVGTAGDTDGDGYSEVIVGAMESSRASIYPGLGTQLSAATATPEGNQSGAMFGWAVGTAGDVNGDGFSDVIIGARGFDVGPGQRGRAYVYHGNEWGIDAGPAWTADGTEIGEFANSAATAGDVNGDGYADVIVGDASADGDSTDSGVVYVYHGSSGGLASTPAWTKSGDRMNAGFGWSVGTAGDVNGDGFSDVIIGSPWYSDPQENEGAAYVYLGSPAGLLTTYDWVKQGNADLATYGVSVGTAGDVNADGYSDVIVGASGYDTGGGRGGAAFVYHGTPGGLNAIADWIDGRSIEGWGFGKAVATAGDVNGDGYSDVIVGAPGADNGQALEGMAWAYHGSPTGLSLTPDWEGDGDQINAQFGTCVATAGDVNGDGYSEVLVSLPTYDGGALQNDEGRIEMYLGRATGLNTSRDFSSVMEGNQQSAIMRVCGTAGDVNADGFSDVITGAWGIDNPDNDEGMAFLHLGNRAKGRARLLRQMRVGGGGPLSPLGMVNSPTSVVLEALGRSPGGRANVRLEVEVKPVGTPFDGTGTFISPDMDSGPAAIGADLSQLVTGLSPATAYRWRARLHTDSPLFPRSRWLWPSDDAPGETDFRTRTSTLAVGPGPGSAGGLSLAPAPNPFRLATDIALTLPHAGDVRLAIHDVQGREVARLAAGHRSGGRHVVRWNPGAMPAGVYFARLEFAGRSVTQQVVLAR